MRWTATQRMEKLLKTNTKGLLKRNKQKKGKKKAENKSFVKKHCRVCRNQQQCDNNGNIITCWAEKQIPKQNKGKKNGFTKQA